MSGPDRLDAIRQRRAAITHLPWETGDEWRTENLYGGPNGDWIGEVLGEENRRFIAHAPGDTDWLVAEVERLRGLLAKLEWSWHGGGCPACHAAPEQSHRSGCELATELGRRS